MLARTTCFGIVILAGVGTGCSQIVGFRDVSRIDAPQGSDAAVDAPDVDAAAIDAAIDAPPPKLWVFLTASSIDGGFGVPNGARVTADIKCQNQYNASFTSRGCNNVHAVIQIDDIVDSLARMAITFPIPQNAQVLRATVDATPVAQDWGTLVNPNRALLAPVSAATSTVPFWSGRGTNSNVQCANWTSAAPGMAGDGGDATKVNQWMSQAAFTCDNFNQHLLCICW